MKTHKANQTKAAGVLFTRASGTLTARVYFKLTSVWFLTAALVGAVFIDHFSILCNTAQCWTHHSPRPPQVNKCPRSLKKFSLCLFIPIFFRLSAACPPSFLGHQLCSTYSLSTERRTFPTKAEIHTPTTFLQSCQMPQSCINTDALMSLGYLVARRRCLT